jgi:hypothetical protein
MHLTYLPPEGFELIEGEKDEGDFYFRAENWFSLNALKEQWWFYCNLIKK